MVLRMSSSILGPQYPDQSFFRIPTNSKALTAGTLYEFAKKNRKRHCFGCQSACPFLFTISKMQLTNMSTMCINTHMDSRTIIKLLEKDGWYKADQSGSHIQFRHPSKRGWITVPHPKKDIPVGTLKSIERQAGIKFK